VRAYINRTDETTEFLKKMVKDKTVVLNPEVYFDEVYWFFWGRESFHGELDDEGFTIKDARLPEMKLPLKHITVED